MEAWLLIDNNNVIYEFKKDLEPHGRYAYQTSYTTDSSETHSVTNIDVPIIIDEKGGNIIQIKLTKTYNIEEINQLKNNVYKEFSVYEDERKNEIYNKVIEYTTFTSLQVKHKFRQISGEFVDLSGIFLNKEDFLDMFLKFEEYLLYQEDRNGNIKCLYPNIPLDLKEYSICDIKFITQISGKTFQSKSNLKLSLSDLKIVK